MHAAIIENNSMHDFFAYHEKQKLGLDLHVSVRHT